MIKALAVVILFCSGIHLMVYFCYTFESEESRTFQEISLCEVTKGVFYGVDPYFHGCFDLQQLYKENSFHAPSFTAVVEGSALKARSKYQAYLVGNSSFKLFQAEMSGSIQLDDGKGNKKFLSNISPGGDTSNNYNNNNARKQKRRRRLLKGGRSSGSWGGSGGSRSSPAVSRSSSYNVLSRRYSRSGFFSRRRFSSARFGRHSSAARNQDGAAGGTSFGVGGGDSLETAPIEEMYGEDMADTFECNVRSYRRMVNDIGNDLCERDATGCRRTLSNMKRVPISNHEITINVLTDTIHLDFFSLKLDTLPLPPSLSTTKYTNMQLYIMFVTNDAQSSVSDLALKIIVYFPVIAALVTLVLYDGLTLFSSEEISKVFFVRKKGTFSGTVSDPDWKKYSFLYHMIVVILLIVLLGGFSDDSLVLGRTITFFLFITTLFSMILQNYQLQQSNQASSIISATQPSLVERRNKLQPWYGRTEEIANGLNNNQQWSCQQEDVTSLRTAIDCMEADTLPDNRRNVLLVEVHDNDITSWTAEDSRRLLGCKYLNLAQNDLTSCGGFEAISVMQDLEMLDVSSNDISSLDGVSSTSLTWLNLAGNELINIRKFGPLPSLLYLDLSSNDLCTLKGLLLSRKRTSVAPSLEALDISNNNIKSGNGSLDALKEMSELKSINLDDNYLDDMKELIDIIQTLPKLRYICAVENDFSEEDEKLLEDYCEQNDIDCEI